MEDGAAAGAGRAGEEEVDHLVVGGGVSGYLSSKFIIDIVFVPSTTRLGGVYRARSWELKTEKPALQVRY